MVWLFRRNLAWWHSSTLLTRRKKFVIKKSKMAAASILKNRKIAISQQRFDRSPQNLALGRRLTAFSIRPLNFWPFKSPRWWQPPFWKTERSPYLSNGLTNCHKIWHDDAFWPSWPFWHSDSRLLKIQDGGGYHFENWNIAMSQQWFDRSPWNLAPCNMLILLTLPTVKNLQFWKMKIQHGGMWKCLW